MEETIAIIGVFGSIPLLVWIVHHYRSKAHNRMSGLIGQMIEKGEAVTPETIRSLGIQPGNPHRDLKAGLVLIAVALAFITLGQIIPDKEAGPAMFGLACFPLFVGAALIGFWYFFGRKNISG